MGWQYAGSHPLKAVLISLAAPQGKRKHFGKLPFQRSFNFGLLSLASCAAENGHNVEVWDLMDPDLDDEPKLAAALLEFGPSLVGISCISGFTYPSLSKVATAVKSVLPEALLIAGGKDHVGQMPTVVLDEVPELDAVVSGYGEETLLALLDEKCFSRESTIAGLWTRGQKDNSDSSRQILRLPSFDYRLFRGFRLLPPSVELGRGCPFNCVFCTSAGSHLVQRSPSELAEQMLQACLAYNNPSLRIYLEAPLATFNKQYLLSLRKELGARGISPTWRAECRVDSLSPGLADELAEAGCRVLDLGLESASPRMLKWMQKGVNPEQYLQRCSRLLPALAAADIFTKINILFFAGESHETLNTTFEYLNARRSSIGAIAAGTLFLYPGIAGESTIREVLSSEGGGVVAGSEWQARHISPVHPSRDLSYEELASVSLTWERDFQSAYDYWYHRQWGYFSPSVTYEEFVAQVRAVGVEHFPFLPETLGSQRT